MKKLLFLLLCAILILNNCSKDETNSVILKDKISGFVQKGPFISGSSILINELDNNLSQTGKVFNTQITDNKGSFVINDIELVSNYVSFRADGFYFNETSGEQSVSQITLYALSDVSDKSNININILSHLEKARIEYLISDSLDFKSAKSKALKEILSIFNINKDNIASSEQLDIFKQGDDNAILLATSLILQGYRTEGELTELLSNISLDIKEDGKLNNNSLGSQLINHAIYLDTLAIRNNLQYRYSDLGIISEIPDFEKYITNFIGNTYYPVTEFLIEYPEFGINGKNILYLNDTVYSGGPFSLAANLTKGTSLEIKITALEDGFWYYRGGSEINWLITIFDDTTKSQVFTAIQSGRSCDLEMLLDSGRFLIEYFEMGASVPTRTKIITK